MGSHAFDLEDQKRIMSDVFSLNAYKVCRKGVVRFDKYCHQYKVLDDDIEGGEFPKFADLR